MTTEPDYTLAMRVLEDSLGRPLREVLSEMYATMSLEEIGVEFNASTSTVARWFRRLGIATMTPRERRLAAAA